MGLWVSVLWGLSCDRGGGGSVGCLIAYNQRSVCILLRDQDGGSRQERETIAFQRGNVGACLADSYQNRVTSAAGRLWIVYVGDSSLLIFFLFVCFLSSFALFLSLSLCIFSVYLSIYSLFILVRRNSTCYRINIFSSSTTISFYTII